MTDAVLANGAETKRERISRRQVDKFAERRAQLADAALQTLAELGYARTSLREIAQNSQFSHGVLHYYFSDKEDLLTHCVRQFEAACVTRYDEIVASAASADELKREFTAAMAQTLRADGTMHRLWYDLRNQSLFEESFRADVLEIDRRREEMIWHVISRYAEFAGITVAASPSAVYAILDGLFQQALLHQLAGRDTAAADLQANVTQVLENLLPGTVIPALLKRHRLLSGTVDLAQPMVALAGIQTISGRVEALNTRGCIRGPSRSAG